jgi:HlyD family secretion protein
MTRMKASLLVGTCIALLQCGCGSGQKPKPQLGEVERWPRLETILPEKDAHLAVRKSYAATVEAFEKVELCAQVRGVIKSLVNDVDIGRHVHKDEELVILDVPDLQAERENKEALLEQARNLKALAVQACNVAAEEVKEVQATLKRYQADLEFRNLQFERVTKLAETDTVARQLAEEHALQLGTSQAALQAAQAQVQTKQARFESAKVELKVADSRIKVAQTELQRLEAMVGFATIRAPFDGVITKRWLDRGATVKDPGSPLLALMRTDHVRVLIDVPERDVPFIKVDSLKDKEIRGNPVTIHIPALQEAVRISEFKGTLTLRAAALDPVTRTMRCEVHLANKEDYLKHQMTGSATVLLAERNVMTLPSSALVRNGAKVEIYYLADPAGNPPKGIVKRMEVQLGLDDGQRVEVISASLTGREQVVRKGVGLVRAGDYAIAVPAQVANGNE